MYETLRIVEKLKPKYVVWENVKNILSKKHRHNFDAYLKRMEQLGYMNYYQVLNAKDYGIPQNRERVFTISIKREGYISMNCYGEIETDYADITQEFEFPSKQELKLKLKDLLENEVDEKYYLSEKAIEGLQRQEFLKHKPNYIENKDYCNTIDTRVGDGTHYSPYLRENDEIKVGDFRYDEGLRIRENGLSPCLTTKIGSKSLSGNTLLIKNATKQGYLGAYDGDGLRIRKLTPKECWRLMGFSDSDFKKAEKVNSNSQLYRQAGNSIVVNVLEAIFKNLFDVYDFSDLD